MVGVDDGPFEKGQAGLVPLVAVHMEGADLVEGVAFSEFPVDGADATAHLVEWIGGSRARAGLQAVVLGGITLAGLGVVDVPGLAAALGLPVLALTRRATADGELPSALRAAGLEERLALVERSPTPVRLGDGLHATLAGIDAPAARALLCAVTRKGRMPEALRLAHMIARAAVLGESRGRV